MRNIVFIVFDGMQSLDLTGPLEVFSGAERSQPGTYRTFVAAATPDPVRCTSGLRITPDGALSRVPRPIDTLIVCGGEGAREARGDEPLVGWLKRAAPRARRIASVCTGAFLLAEAGLLNGRRATTHWARAEEMADRFPEVIIDPEPIFTQDGRLYTSAGVTAGMDLALALVEQDLGRDAALLISRWLVLFLRRPGGQAQFSAQLQSQLAQRSALRELQSWIVEHPSARLDVDALAERAAMSSRHFARSFRQEVGVTPGRYVEQVRLEAARRRLEDSREHVGAIAEACGFGTAETMRRSFIRALGVAPAEYRRRFTGSQAA